MNTAQPIKRITDLNNFKNYYKSTRPHGRNSLLIVMGLNTALRISDILPFKWEHVYDFERQEYRSHVSLIEQKTGKRTQIYMNDSIVNELKLYWEEVTISKGGVCPEYFLFCHSNKNQPITRVQAFRIIRRAAENTDIAGVISCHSLRKTFGYHAWKQGAEPALLVNIYNHSTYQVTKRYLGIEQDDRDQVFKSINL